MKKHAEQMDWTAEQLADEREARWARVIGEHAYEVDAEQYAQSFRAVRS